MSRFRLFSHLLFLPGKASQSKMATRISTTGDLSLVITKRELKVLEKRHENYFDASIFFFDTETKLRAGLGHSSSPLFKYVEERGGIQVVLPKSHEYVYPINLTDLGFEHLKRDKILTVDYSHDCKVRIVVEG